MQDTCHVDGFLSYWYAQQNLDLKPKSLFIKHWIRCTHLRSSVAVYLEEYSVQSRPLYSEMLHVIRPGTRPTDDISFKFDQNLQCSGLKCAQPITTKSCTRHDSIIVLTFARCRCEDSGDLCKISLWSADYIMNKNILKSHWISNSIEIPLVGRAPGRAILGGGEMGLDHISAKTQYLFLP